MSVENPNHIPVKHMGLVGFANVSVGIPSRKEAEQAARALAPLRRRTGLTWSLDDAVKAKYPSLATRIRRRLTR